MKENALEKWERLPKNSRNRFILNSVDERFKRDFKNIYGQTTYWVDEYRLNCSVVEIVELQCILSEKKHWDYSEVNKWIDFFYDSRDKSLALTIIQAMP